MHWTICWKFPSAWNMHRNVLIGRVVPQTHDVLSDYLDNIILKLIIPYNILQTVLYDLLYHDFSYYCVPFPNLWFIKYCLNVRCFDTVRQSISYNLFLYIKCVCYICSAVSLWLVTNLSCVVRHNTHVHKFHKVSLLQIAARDNRSLRFTVSWSPSAQESCPGWRCRLDCMCPTCILAKGPCKSLWLIPPRVMWIIGQKHWKALFSKKGLEQNLGCSGQLLPYLTILHSQYILQLHSWELQARKGRELN